MKKYILLALLFSLINTVANPKEDVSCHVHWSGDRTVCEYIKDPYISISLPGKYKVVPRANTKKAIELLLGKEMKQLAILVPEEDA